MSPAPLLSILTPAVPSRMKQLGDLCAEIGRQCEGRLVEHLALLDNKSRTVGEKRDALLRAARGHYIAFVDDDDWIAPNYVSSLCRAMFGDGTREPDVITFNQEATVDGKTGGIRFGLGNPDEQFAPGWVIQRGPWHVCAWKRALAVCSSFPATNYGEDLAFCLPLRKLAKTSVHIDKVLHYYRHSSATTEAPPP